MASASLHSRQPIVSSSSTVIVSSLNVSAYLPGIGRQSDGVVIRLARGSAGDCGGRHIPPIAGRSCSFGSSIFCRYRRISAEDPVSLFKILLRLILK